MKYHGFISPAPPKGAPKELKQFMARTYAGLRKTKYPGENKQNKMRAARITWYQTKRKFPGFFSHKKARTRTNPRYPASVRKEKKEHPWLSWKEAERVDRDHKREEAGKMVSPARSNIRYVKPARTAAGRKRQVRDLKSAAKEQKKIGDDLNIQAARIAMIER